MTKKVESQIRELLVLQERMNRVFRECRLNSPSEKPTNHNHAGKNENDFLFIFKSKPKKHRPSTHAGSRR